MAQLWPTVDARTLVVNVDRALYVVWAVVYAGLGALLCHWLSQFTTPHIIADQLPWRGLYNTLFSDGLLLIVVLLAVLWWLRHDGCGQMRQGIAMLLPVVALYQKTWVGLALALAIVSQEPYDDRDTIAIGDFVWWQVRRLRQ